MKKLIALCLPMILCLFCVASCGLLMRKIEHFLPNEHIISVEIKNTDYETGNDEITEKYVLSAAQSYEIKALLSEITYEKRYNILQQKWTYFNDVQYIFTFETQKIVLSENHIYIYNNNDTLINHVEFNYSTFSDYAEEINEVLSASDLSHTNVSDKGIEDTATIEITYFDVSSNLRGTVTVTDETIIKHIVDNITSLKLKPRETEHGEPSPIKYKLFFFDANGKTIRTMNISPDGRINFCDVISGELDIAYLEGLFEQETPSCN